MAAGPTGVYWIGQDGNVWVGMSDGSAQNYGAPLAAPQNGGVDATLASIQATRIADPNPQTGPTAPNGTTGTTYADKSNDIALQTKGLAAIPDEYNTGISSVDKALGSIKGRYDIESATNEGTYKGQSDTNQGNFQRNKESSLVNAANGRRGLFGTLASLGALSGSGIDLANRAVQTGANEDLTSAGDTFSANQGGLDNSIGAFRAADKERRAEADAAAADAKTKVKYNASKDRQGFYTNLANDYSAEGDTGNAGKYSGLASEEYATMAKNIAPDTNLAYTGAAFTPSTLNNYLVNGNTAVSTTPAQGSKLPGLLATNPLANDQRKKQPVAA